MTKDLAELSVLEVQAWLNKELDGHGSTVGRDSLQKSFLRLKVDGKTLVSLVRRKCQREWRMGVYGVLKSLREPLMLAVERSVLSSSPVKKLASKGRGKPRFIGKRKVTMPDSSEVRDSPMSMARHMAMKDERNKNVFDKNGWPNVEVIGFEQWPEKQRSKEIELAFKPQHELTSEVIGFRDLTPKQVAEFVVNVLSKNKAHRMANLKKLAVNIEKQRLTGKQLASICAEKSARKRYFRFSPYSIPKSIAAEITDAVRLAVPGLPKKRYAKVEHAIKSKKTQVESSGSAPVLRVPNGGRVRDNVIAIAKYMWRRNAPKKAEDAEPHFPWDGSVHVQSEKKQPEESKFIFKGRPRRINDTDSVDEVYQWACYRIGGRSGKRIGSLLRKAKVDGAHLITLMSYKKLSAFSVYRIPFSLRKVLREALRAEKERNAKMDRFLAKPKTFTKYNGRGFVTIKGKKCRDSHVSIAKLTEVTMKKKAPFKKGFPEFEWVTGGYKPLVAKTVDETAAWVSKTLKAQPSKSSLIRSIKQFKVNGERLAHICSRTPGVNSRLSAIGAPHSTRSNLVQAVRKATPKSFKLQSFDKRSRMIKCPDGTKIRDSTVAMAKHMRFSRRGYKQRPETEWPEIEIVAKPAPVGKRKFRKSKKGVKPKGSALPQSKSKQRQLDQNGWPEVDVVLKKTVQQRRSFASLQPEEVQMWAREKLGRHVGIKVMLDRVAKYQITGKMLARLARNKTSSGMAASMGIPFSLRKPLVQAVKKQDNLPGPTPKRSWVGLRDITLPDDGKTTLRDSALTIGRHYNKLKGGKIQVAATKLKTNGWPSITLVMAEDFEKEPVKIPSDDFASMGHLKVAKWAEMKYKGYPEMERLTKSIIQNRISGDVLASLANLRKNRDLRLGMYGVPYCMRTELMRDVRSRTVGWRATQPKTRKFVSIGGVQIRNSMISLAIHTAKKAKKARERTNMLQPHVGFEMHKNFRVRLEAQPDLLEMDASEFSAWAGRKLRGTTGYRKELPAALLRNRVTGRMFADLLVHRGPAGSRNGRMQSFGVNKSNRRSFFELAQRTVPPTAFEELRAKRPFMGMLKVMLPMSMQLVRDSPVTIMHKLNEFEEKPSYKKTSDESGFPPLEWVTKASRAASAASSPSKKTVSTPRPAPEIMVVGTALLPKSTPKTANRGLSDLPDDLRNFSTEEVSRWVEATLDDRALARRFIRNGITGRTLASLRDTRYGLSGKLAMLGVKKSLRAKLIRLVRRAAKPLKYEEEKFWFSPSGERVRNSAVAIAKHTYMASGKIVDVVRTDDSLPGFLQMGATATTYWVYHTLRNDITARALQRLNVSGERLAAIVGSPSGRNARLAAYGIPYSVRRALVKAVKAAVPDWKPATKDSTMTCPDGSKIRNSTISFARWSAKKSKAKNVSGWPIVEIFLAKSAPLVCMRTHEVASFVRSALERKSGPSFRGSVARVLSNLTKYKVDGSLLVEIAQSNKESRAARLSALGVCQSARGPLLRAVEERIKQDKANDYGEIYENVMKKEVFQGLTMISLSFGDDEPVLVRDSVAMVSKFYDTRRGKKYSKAPVFIFGKDTVVESVAFDEDIKLEELSVEQLGAWLSSNPRMRSLSKNDVATLISNLKRRKVSGRDLVGICLAAHGSDHMLSSRGIRTNVRSALVQTVKNAMKDKRTGYTVIPPKQSAGDDIVAKAKKGGSMMEAFRKHKAEGKKEASLNWPDIEVLHRAPAAKGGTQISKFMISSKSEDMKNSFQQNWAVRGEVRANSSPPMMFPRRVPRLLKSFSADEADVRLKEFPRRDEVEKKLASLEPLQVQTSRFERIVRMKSPEHFTSFGMDTGVAPDTPPQFRPDTDYRTSTDLRTQTPTTVAGVRFRPGTPKASPLTAGIGEPPAFGLPFSTPEASLVTPRGGREPAFGLPFSTPASFSTPKPSLTPRGGRTRAKVPASLRSVHFNETPVVIVSSKAAGKHEIVVKPGAAALKAPGRMQRKTFPGSKANIPEKRNLFTRDNTEQSSVVQ